VSAFRTMLVSNFFSGGLEMMDFGDIKTRFLSFGEIGDHLQPPRKFMIGETSF
jgi:hypothetical protein